MQTPADVPRGRYFVGVWPDRDTAAEIERTAGSYRQQGSRGVAVGDLHLTLVFLGPLRPAECSAATVALERVDAVPFELVLDRVGGFGRSGVLWLGPRQPPARLVALRGELTTRLDAAGLDFDRRPFRPHVTIARRSARRGAEPLPTPIVWRIDTLALATARSSPMTGPRYEQLAVKILA